MDKVTRQCHTNHNLFQEKGEPKRYRTEVLPLTNLTPYRYAKPARTVPVLSLASFGRGRGSRVQDVSQADAKGRYTGFRVQELCESRDGRPGLPVPNKPDGFCGRKETLNSGSRP